MKTLTVFTPTFNRKHTLCRTYYSLCAQTNTDFEWLVIDDGSEDGTKEIVLSWISEEKIPIRYIWKENGGLHTGYNTAYANIETELCVCIDSDDFMPEDAVDKILALWKLHYPKGSRINPLSVITNEEYCGLEGLDYNVKDQLPIGGRFPENKKSLFMYELNHHGDSKTVMRTDLVKKYVPMPVFPGEKNFNPAYLLMQVQDELPMLLLNENLCWVEYQTTDSMSAGIWRQYHNSPNSYAEYRRLEMRMKHNDMRNKFRLAIHYVSSCLLAKDKDWFTNSPEKILTFLAAPVGLGLYLYIIWKNR